MRISEAQRTPQMADAGSVADRARSPEEVAKKFEEVLARQFVQVMTKDLFKNTLAGENGPAWMGSYSDTQRDILTNALAEHLTDKGTLGISDLILRRWNLTGVSTEDEPAPASTPKSE